MKKEKIILSFIAVIFGIIVAAVAFYLYQSTKTIPSSKPNTLGNKTLVVPTQKPSVFLSVDTPDDEKVFNKKTIQVAGKTVFDAVVIVSTQNADKVFVPAQNGNFSTTAELDDGQNIIEITAISPDGQEASVKKAVTFSTEEF